MRCRCRSVAVALVVCLLAAVPLDAQDADAAAAASPTVPAGRRGVEPPDLETVLPEVEFRDEPLANVMMVIGDLAGLSIVCDSTVSGRVTSVLRPMSAAAALETLTAEHGAMWWVGAGVVHVSRVRVRRGGSPGTLSVEAWRAPISAVARRVAGVAGPSLMYDPLPSEPVSLSLSDVAVSELARLLVHRHPRFAVEMRAGAIIIRDTGRPGAGRQNAALQIDRTEAGFTVRAHGVSLARTLARLFDRAEREYVLLAEAGRTLENLHVSGHGFDAVLSRILAAANAAYDTQEGTYYIYDIDRSTVLAGLEQSVRVSLSHISAAELESLLPARLRREDLLRIAPNRNAVVVTGRSEEVTPVLRFIGAVDEPPAAGSLRRFDLAHAEVEAVLAALPERFASARPVRVPGANALLARLPEEEAHAFDRFLTLMDRREPAAPVRLRYIRAADLIRHAPPDVDMRHIHTTPDPRVVMISGSAETRRALRAALGVIDKPVPQIRYQLLVIQYQKGRAVEWSSQAEVGPMRPGDSTVLLGRIGELLSLDFDIVTSLGYRFAVDLSARLAENEARVLADTTLNGLSGRAVELRNTDTFRYRDQPVDPETGETEVLGVTREITSGLFLDIEGWASGESMITMDIGATLSRRGTDVSTDGTIPPPTSERVVDTRVRTRSGRPVVIGGLIQQSVSRTLRRTPVLGSIPLFGWAFRSTERSVEETELVLYLLPVIEKAESPRSPAARIRSYRERFFEVDS